MNSATPLATASPHWPALWQLVPCGQRHVVDRELQAGTEIPSEATCSYP